MPVVPIHPQCYIVAILTVDQIVHILSVDLLIPMLVIVLAVVELCKKGPKHAQIRNVQIKLEKFQDFKVFKVLHI